MAHPTWHLSPLSLPVSQYPPPNLQYIPSVEMGEPTDLSLDACGVNLTVCMLARELVDILCNLLTSVHVC